MACTVRLGGDGLACVRADDHNNGHIYHSTSGGWVPDHHDARSGGEH